MTTEQKIHFIKNTFISELNGLKSQTKPKWGIMNAQQMVEHMADSFKIANGKINKQLITAPDQVEKYKTFMMSDKPFKENTKNIELPETPMPTRNESYNMSIEELKKEVNLFFEVFENNKSQKKIHSIFGELNFEEWIQLLHKHAVHHLKQFNIEIV